MILDDTFLPALTYVSTKMVGDEKVLDQLESNLNLQHALVAELKEELVNLRSQVMKRYEALQAAVGREAGAVANEPGLIGGIVNDLLDAGLGVVPVLGSVGNLFGIGSTGPDPEASRIRREAADAAYGQALSEERDLRGRLDREVTALGQATTEYNDALRASLNGQVQVARLRTHIKQNILYYMQAIWSHEPPDQRFFRLHKVPVPTLRAKTRTYFVEGVADKAAMAFAAHRGVATPEGRAALPYRFSTTAEFETDLEFDPLAKVADLDRPLGFKGNYMIFPLYESNDLTEFMMTPYVDRGFGTVIDPDELGNWTLEDFARYVCCLEEHLTDEQFAEVLPDLKEQYQRLLVAPHRNGEEIALPTDSLFIDFLPGVRPVLEEFKLVHRLIDLTKAQAEARKEELENLRRAARLLANEYEDPDIEKKVVLEGIGATVTAPTGDA